MDREIHEVIENGIVKVDCRPQEAQKGQFYVNKMGYEDKILEGITPDLDDMEDKNPTYKLRGKALINAYNGIDYNYPEHQKKLSLLKTKALHEQDYMTILDFLRSTYTYNQIDDFILYKYARTLVGKPLTTTEQMRIKGDISSIKKYWKKQNKKMKKKEGQYKVEFK